MGSKCHLGNPNYIILQFHVFRGPCKDLPGYLWPYTAPAPPSFYNLTLGTLTKKSASSWMIFPPFLFCGYVLCNLSSQTCRRESALIPLMSAKCAINPRNLHPILANVRMWWPKQEQRTVTSSRCSTRLVSFWDRGWQTGCQAGEHKFLEGDDVMYPSCCIALQKLRVPCVTHTQSEWPLNRLMNGLRDQSHSPSLWGNFERFNHLNNHCLITLYIQV